MKPDKIVFSVPDDTGRIVHLFEPQWRHILDGHPEMRDHQRAMKATVSEPTLVSAGNRARCQVFERIGATDQFPWGLKICRVFVDKTDDPKVGFIRTAYFPHPVKWYDQRVSPTDQTIIPTRILRDGRS